MAARTSPAVVVSIGSPTGRYCSRARNPATNPATQAAFSGIVKTCHSLRSSELNHDDPSSFTPPNAFGPFRVLHQIGSGVLGPVFRTYEPERDRLIAVKAFRIDLLPEQTSLLADELRAIVDAGLVHGGIVQPLAAGLEGHLPYLAQEYVAAESLDVAMKHYAPAAPARVLPFLRTIAGAIDAAAAAGIRHGALHPRDIFVTADEARATGFGIVQAIENIGFRAPTRRPYTAPERVADEEWGTAADVFSLGAITHELLTGRRPAGPGDQDGTFAADVPAEYRARLREVLARALAEEPEARFASAAAFVEALEHAADGRRPSAAASASAAPLLFDEPAAPQEEDEEGVFDLDAAQDGMTFIAGDEAGRDIEDPVEVADTSDVEELDATDGGEVQDVTDLTEEEGHEVQRQDTWPPPGFTTDDPDIAAERDTDAALGDFDLHMLNLDPVRGPSRSDAAGDMTRDDLASLDRPSSPDYEVAADNDEDEPFEGTDYDAIPPYVAAGPAAGASARDMSFVDPGVAAPRRSPFVWLVAGVAIGFLLAWFWFGRQTVTPAVLPEPATVETAEEAPSGEMGIGADETLREPEPVELSPAPPVSAPVPTPAPSPESGAAPPAAATPAARGVLVVRSTPSNAHVVIDGTWRGRTPFTMRDVEFGEHTVRVVADGHTPEMRTVSLTSGQSSQTLTFSLTPSRQSDAPGIATGSVMIDSRPSGARVLLDGREVGTTPLRLDRVPSGAHHVRIELQNYRPWTTTIQVERGQQVRVAASLEQR